MDHTLDFHHARLRAGDPAFLVGYHDRNLTLPFVEPYVFLGRATDPAGAVRFYFQAADDYVSEPAREPWSESEKTADMLVADEEMLSTMVDWDGLAIEIQERLAELKGAR